jgi:hypothetical protein
MKRHLIKLVTGLILIVIVGALVFTGCAEEEPPPPPPPPPVEEEEEPPPPVEEVYEWPDKLAIVTSPGLGMASTTGYSSPLAAEKGISIRIVPEANYMNRFLWVSEGLFFLTSEAVEQLIQVIQADEGHATRDGGPFHARTVWSNSRAEAGFFVRGDSWIYDIYDLRPGTKIVDFAFAPGFWEQSIAALLAWPQVDPEDVVRVPAGSPGAAIRAISGGTADICFFFPMYPDLMEVAAAPHGIRWVDMPYDEDPEGRARYSAYEPITTFGVMSETPECEGIRGIVTVTSSYTRAETDAELIYNWVKWINENYDLYKDNHAWNKTITLENYMAYISTSPIPVHEGTIRYLKELGLWTAAHDARQAENIALIDLYIEEYQEAIELADDQGITVSPDNEEWSKFWTIRRMGLPQFLLKPAIK